MQDRQGNARLGEGGEEEKQMTNGCGIIFEKIVLNRPQERIASVRQWRDRCLQKFQKKKKKMTLIGVIRADEPANGRRNKKN